MAAKEGGGGFVGGAVTTRLWEGMLIDRYWAFEGSGESCAVVVGTERQREGSRERMRAW